MQNESKWRAPRAVVLSCGSNEEGVAAKLWKTVYKLLSKTDGEKKKKRLRLKCKWNRKLSSAKQRECSSDASENGLLSFTYTARGIRSCFGAETARKHPAFRLPGSLKSWWKGDKHNQIQFFKTNITKLFNKDLLKHIYSSIRTFSCANPVGFTQTW